MSRKRINRKKRRIISVSLIVLALALIVGVGAYFLISNKDDKKQTVCDTGLYKDESDVNNEETTDSSNGDTESTGDFSFLDLAEYTYAFSSGAGGWEDEFEIEKDGYFHGYYHDSDMGDSDEGYENGTIYYCHYSGHLENLEKVDDLTYTMKIKDIKVDDEETEEYIDEFDQIKYIPSSPYALSECDSLTIYLPGTSIDTFSDEVKLWIDGCAGSSIIENDKLTGVVIINNPNDYGICGTTRLPAKERAQMYYDSYKESIDYFGELLAQSVTTADMVQYTYKQSELADELLNKLWIIVKYDSTDEEFEERLAEQREWISQRDKEAQEISNNSGSLSSVDYNDYMATSTMERCEALIEYLK